LGRRPSIVVARKGGGWGLRVFGESGTLSRKGETNGSGRILHSTLQLGFLRKELQKNGKEGNHMYNI